MPNALEAYLLADPALKIMFVRVEGDADYQLTLSSTHPDVAKREIRAFLRSKGIEAKIICAPGYVLRYWRRRRFYVAAEA